MISVTRLLLGGTFPGDALRFGQGAPPSTGEEARETRGFVPPVLVWHLTPDCPLACRHCYARAGEQGGRRLSLPQGLRLIDEAADLGVPALLLSGGEPLASPHLWEWLERARARGLRTTLSTGGTLIDGASAARLASLGPVYAGVSLDGTEEVHDRFRGTPGAFRAALEGLDRLAEAGIRTGLRFTLARSTLSSLDGIFRLAEERAISRICLYHFVPAGRGGDASAERLSREETRGALDRIGDWARRLGPTVEVLTVDNPSDGPYLLGKLPPSRAVLPVGRGNRSGEGIVSIRWDGRVFPDQFSWAHPLGGFPERSLASILRDEPSDLLRALRTRRGRIGGRCSRCVHFPSCNGGLRARAEALTGDFWASDPGCVLLDGEIRETPASSRRAPSRTARDASASGGPRGEGPQEVLP